MTIEAKDLQNVDKKVTVDLSFLCEAGLLLMLSKYMVLFIEKNEECQQVKQFKEIVDLDFNAKRSSKTAVASNTRSNLLKQVCPYFSLFASSAASFLDTVKLIGGAESTGKGYFDEIIAKFVIVATKLLSLCNDELGQSMAWLDELFNKVVKSHAVPGIFQGEKIEKPVVSALVGDHECAKLLFLGSKISTLASDLKIILEAMASLCGNDSLLPTSFLNMFSALQSDVAKYCGNSEMTEILPKEGDKVVLANFSKFQGSMTLAQCLTRDLQPGETRIGLTRRCMELFQSKGIKCEASLMRQAQALSGK